MKSAFHGIGLDMCGDVETDFMGILAIEILDRDRTRGAHHNHTLIITLGIAPMIKLPSLHSRDEPRRGELSETLIRGR